MAHLYLNDPFTDGNSPSDIKGNINQRADDPPGTIKISNFPKTRKRIAQKTIAATRKPVL